MTQFRGIIERAYNTFDPTPSEAQYQHKASNAAGLFLTWTKKIWNTFIFCFPLLFWLGETREKEQKNLYSQLVLQFCSHGAKPQFGGQTWESLTIGKETHYITSKEQQEMALMLKATRLQQ